jgi:glycerophosphoryl diester phosphodiesterase
MFVGVPMLDTLLNVLCGLCDWTVSLIPQAKPTAAQLQSCQIVAHRGAHDTPDILENTLAAFDRAQDLGVWGIELDVRWTQDGVPVVIHDETAERVFGQAVRIADISFADLIQRVPDIPSLQTVIERYGKKMHLMIELKAEDVSDPSAQTESLKDLLKDLVPVQDYHILVLDPKVFALVDFVPKSAWMLVSEVGMGRVSDIALQDHYGSVAGHYLLMRKKFIDKHHQAGQGIGIGFAASKNALYREINRGVDWIFTNHPERLMSKY